MRKPVPQDFQDVDGYTDWEDYDFALQAWEHSVPLLDEWWCPTVEHHSAQVDETCEDLAVFNIVELLEERLAAQ